MTPEQVGEFLPQFASDTETIKEIVVVSTCHRTEWYVATENIEAAKERLCASLAAFKGIDRDGMDEFMFQLEDDEAIHHLFKVASGLESLMLGEAEIMGQLDRAWSMANVAGTTHELFDRLFKAAIRSGGIAREETAIGRGTVSVAYAAVQLAKGGVASLVGKKAVVVGAGDTGQLVAKHLGGSDAAGLTILNRTLEKAEVLAEKYGATAMPLEALSEELSDADIVVTAITSTDPVVTEAMVREVMVGRSDRPLTIVDIASPRNVDQGVADIPQVTVHDVDGLDRVVQKNQQARLREVPKVEAIVQRELKHFLSWFKDWQLKPVIRALRHRFERISVEELDAFHAKSSDVEREKLEQFAGRLIAKFLHQPMKHIKSVDRSTDEGRSTLNAVCELFELPLTADAVIGDAMGVGIER